MDANNLAQKTVTRLAQSSPQLAAARFRQHILNWSDDLELRRDFYSGVVEAALPTMKPEESDLLRRIWEGMLQRADARTVEEVEAIDAWLEPLYDATPPSGDATLLACLMDCAGGYFTEAVNAEIEALAQVPGFDAAFDQLEWPNER